MILDLTITHLEELLAGATPGFWDHDNRGRAWDADNNILCEPEGGFDPQDLALVVALRNAAPALIARVRELENPQIATVIDPDTGFTINGPEWLQLPLKARLIIQELSLQNDDLRANLSCLDYSTL